MWLDKLVLKCPTFKTIKKELSSGFPKRIEIIFKSKEDNIEEFEIIYYLINVAGYFFDELKPIDNSHLVYVAYFKRKS